MCAGDASRQVSDLKFKLVKAEQEVTALEQNVSAEGHINSLHIQRDYTLFSLQITSFFPHSLHFGSTGHQA